MKKYIVLFAVVFCLSVHVAKQDRRAAQQGAQKIVQQGSASVPNPLWYEFVRWPTGTATWAIVLTLFAIADQTTQTRKSVEIANRTLISGYVRDSSIEGSAPVRE